MDANDKLIQTGMAQWYALREERDKLNAMCVNWERAHTMLQSENEMLKQRITALEAEKGFYQRFSSELVANVADIGRLCEGVLVKSKQGAYRPNGAAPRQQDEPPDGVEVPRFLLRQDQRGADEPGNGLEADAGSAIGQRLAPVRGFNTDNFLRRVTGN